MLISGGDPGIMILSKVVDIGYEAAAHENLRYCDVSALLHDNKSTLATRHMVTVRFVLHLEN